MTSSQFLSDSSLLASGNEAADDQVVLQNIVTTALRRSDFGDEV